MTQHSSPALDFSAAPPYISFTMEAKIRQMQAEKAKRDTELQEAIQYLELQRLTQNTPRRILETPGPHRLHEKAPRPQDIELQQKLQLQSEAEAALKTTNNSAPLLPNNQNLIDVFKQLGIVMKDNNASDTTKPAHFNGSDGKWDEFYSQLRTYLSAKDWLTTFEHPIGPGATGFNNKVNKKLYNKLLMLCKTGHAATYIKKERARVRTTLKEVESQKNLATIAASLDTQSVTVEEDKERRKKSKTTMRREQKK